MTHWTLEQAKTYIVVAFSACVVLTLLGFLGASIYLRVQDENADVGIYNNIMFSSLAYIVGIISGLFGLDRSGQPSNGTVSRTLHTDDDDALPPVANSRDAA